MQCKVSYAQSNTTLRCLKKFRISKWIQVLVEANFFGKAF